jgi:tripeptide aminopeptidase
MTKSLLDRFLNYVSIDTQSDPTSDSCPSTEKQKDLGRVLVEELLQLGLVDAHMDDFGYVYATIPGNTDFNDTIPVICYCSHMDTSPDCSGAGVKPIIHNNYQGGDIILPDDPQQIIRMKDHPDLKAQIGNDIITASGHTLLGADNKSGIAAIMDAAQYLVSHPEIKHGHIKILFTPDEEIGRGVDKVDIQKLGADFGYTIDGESLGSIENETFSADAATIQITGVATHPGFAKGKMENAIRIAAEIIDQLPKKYLSPETTSGKEGFLHPVSVKGSLESAEIVLIIRDFDDELLKIHGDLLRRITDKVISKYPGSKASIVIREQYRNMKKVLDQYPEVTEYGLEAIRMAGLTPRLSSIRGGTDGSRLSYMGLPCPNIFAGEHAFHSRLEWVSLQDMEKASLTIVNLSQLWTKSNLKK